jgi:hypothetical protein
MRAPIRIHDVTNDTWYNKSTNLFQGADSMGVASYSSPAQADQGHMCQEAYHSTERSLSLFPGDTFKQDGTDMQPMTFKGSSWHDVGVRGISQKLIVEISGKIRFCLLRQLVIPKINTRFSIVDRAPPGVRATAFAQAIEFVEHERLQNKIIFLENGVIGGRVAIAQRARLAAQQAQAQQAAAELAAAQQAQAQQAAAELAAAQAASDRKRKAKRAGAKRKAAPGAAQEALTPVALTAFEVSILVLD